MWQLKNKYKHMKVYKFGGASVKDAAGVRNVISIIEKVQGPLVVVVSAMGKTTNLLEELVEAYFSRNIPAKMDVLQTFRRQHQLIINDLFGEQSVYQPQFNDAFDELSKKLDREPSINYDFEYDQIVPFGEIISSLILSHALLHQSIDNIWIDARKVLKTDEIYRDAGINWPLTTGYMKQVFDFSKCQRYVFQGFIGSTINNISTTLGREGSDYTAAIIGHVMDAEDVTIWKDVPGVLNADPRWYPNASMLPEISYWEAIELTYFGAQVIHPKTLKPLQNKKIPLNVKSFIDPSLPGTIIRQVENEDIKIPVYILKPNQLFVTFSPVDFSFIVEENLSEIFSILSEFRIKVNLMQNSALDFSICIDKTRGVERFLERLRQKFVVRYNDHIELVTIRHYHPNTLQSIMEGKEIIDSQITRKTARFVLKASPWNFAKQ